MLINLRNALMSGKRLPYDAEVEYLECAGTSSVFPYIDTGIVGSMDVTVSARVWKSTKSINECAMGSWDRGSTRCWPLYFNDNKYYLGMGSLASTLTEVTSEVWHDIALTKSGNTFIYTADGTVVGQASSTSTFASTRTLYIGAMNDAGNPFYYFRGRFAFVKIYVAGVLVRDYIPVRKGTTGYLYDRVTGALLGNAGTGDFVVGPDVVPVEYIESHGTEWIDTGIYGTEDLDTELVCQQLEINPISPNGKGIFGAFNTTTKNSYYLYQHGVLSGNTDYQVGFGSYTNTGTVVDLNKHTFRFSDYRVYMDETVIATLASGSMNTTPHTLLLFNTHKNNGGIYDALPQRFYRAKFIKSNVLIGSFLPIRVGTDATSWEGAMMDVLTRKVYRNAGTGAFAYGNDLKYPIPAE